jgi:hypothetical protein
LLSLDKDAWLSARLLGVDVTGARDGSWSCLCLAAMPSHMGADVDGLACFLHCPTVCSWQTQVQCSLTGVAISHHVAVVGGAFSASEKPQGVDIYRGVDRAGT